MAGTSFPVTWKMAVNNSFIAYSDLEAHDFDYAAVKAKGLQRTEGKEYVVKDGDVIEFLFNV